MYVTPYSCDRRSSLCLTYKDVIAGTDQGHILNKRTETIYKCCHKNTFNEKILNNIVVDIQLKYLTYSNVNLFHLILYVHCSFFFNSNGYLNNSFALQHLLCFLSFR